MPVPEPEEEVPSTSGRPLQRSKPSGTTSNGLIRATDTLRRSQQDKGVTRKVTLNAKHKRGDKRKAVNNTRFSQEAGRLSQKDWQVDVMHWTLGLAKPAYLCNWLTLVASAGNYRLADH